MFLTKKSFGKIIIVAICYFVLGSIFFGLAYVSSIFKINSTPMYVIGAVAYILCPILILCGLYSEGKGKFINLGNKLVRHELKPAEFINLYEDLKSSTGLVINKPNFEVLQLAFTAYFVLDNKEAALSTIDKMISIANKKRIVYAKLLKTSLLFSYGQVEEAEALFDEARGSKQSIASLALTDAILKSDRAMALGDYKTVEFYNLKLLTQAFPKPDNLSRLAINFELGEVYEKMQDIKKAIPYYEYCVTYGGETAKRDAAKSALDRLKI